MTAIGATCQHRITTRLSTAPGDHARRVACGKDARWVGPDGEVRTVLLYDDSTGLQVSLCCAKRVSRAFYRDVQARYPGFPDGWSPAPAPPPADQRAPQWFRHALADTVRATNGLMRQDGSGSEPIGAVNIVRLR